jgi:hypothetical protein
LTDDPEPVEYRHWEMYLASQSFHDKDGWTAARYVRLRVVRPSMLHLASVKIH